VYNAGGNRGMKINNEKNKGKIRMGKKNGKG
jgi:hypothetical protein